MNGYYRSSDDRAVLPQRATSGGQRLHTSADLWRVKQPRQAPANDPRNCTVSRAASWCSAVRSPGVGASSRS